MTEQIHEAINLSDIDDLDIPRWIEGGAELTSDDIDAICQGGCASGAFMPAVTYYNASKMMGEHGDDVLEYVEEHYGEIPQPKPGESWSGMAVFYLSIAVELWAGGVAQTIEYLDDV